MVGSFLSKLQRRSARRNPIPPIHLRAPIDGIVLESADKLAAGDADAASVMEKLQAALISGTDLREILQRALGRLSDTIEKEFLKAGAPISIISCAGPFTIVSICFVRTCRRKKRSIAG